MELRPQKGGLEKAPQSWGTVISASHSTSAPWSEASIVQLLCSYEKKKNLSFISSFAADSLQFPRIHFFPYLIFIKIQKLLGGFKKYKN